MSEKVYPNEDSDEEYARDHAVIVGVGPTPEENEAYHAAMSKAREIGAEHGTAAASWVFDGNTDGPTYAWFVRALDEGDPAVYDHLPAPDLSGQWADGYLPRDLARDCEVSDEDTEHSDENDLVTITTELCDAYCDAFSEAVEREVRRAAEYQLSD